MSTPEETKKPETVEKKEEKKEETDKTQSPAYAIFKKYDLNGDETIDVCELQNLCVGLGVYLSAEELRMAVHVLDIDGDGVIAFPEFERWWLSNARFDNLRRSAEELQFLNGVFSQYLAFDRDMDGRIGKGEFEPLHEDVKKSGLPVNTVEMDWDIMDQDKNGWISFNEFVDWILFLFSQLQQAQQPQQFCDASAPSAPTEQ